MLTAFVSALKTPDLRRKILFTLAMLLVYRFGATLPAPGVNYTVVHKCLDEIGAGGSGQTFTLLNLFSGGALLQLSVFALGIMPYITASIIVQLLVVVIPRFEQLKKEGQAGQAKMTQYTRYITIGLGVLQSTGFIALAKNGQMFQGCSDATGVVGSGSMTLITLVIVMTAGTTAIMWLGELITDRGIGNGMSLLIFTSIASRIVPEGQNILANNSGVVFGVMVALAMAIIIAVVYIEQGQRRLPVQYAKRMIGRKSYGGTSTYLPLKVNQGGVIPVIFASSLLYIPTLITSLLSATSTDEDGNQVASPAVLWVNEYIGNPGSWSHMLLYFVLIIFFTYFYVGIQFNPVERADDLKKYGGFIPGIRPGRPTAEYLQFVLSRITLPGSLYLGTVAIMPDFFLSVTGSGNNQNFPFGGVSVLILVAVGLDTMKQIESQLMQRNYEGFLR